MMAEPSTNPFDELNSDQPQGAPMAPPKPAPNPFEALNSDQPVQAPDQSSATGAFARGAARGAVPAIGSLPAMAAGAEVGAEAGGLVGGPPGALVGGLVGGAAGGFGAAALLDRAQNWALSKLPDSWREKIGLDDRQQQIDEGEHPVASFMGGIVPYALTMRPGAVPTTALPENATALQRIMAHPVTARLFGGAAMGGMELGQEAAEDDHISWPRVAIATGFGLIFNRPTRIGEAITELGARPTRTVLGIKQPVPAVPPPTLAQAGDAKVMGPGVTEPVFQGTQAQDPAAAMTAQEAARAEQSVLAPQPEPDLHATARRMEPELFAHYDDLIERRNVTQDWLDEQGPENAPAATKHLADIQKEIEGVSPEIAAAYRRAADATGAAAVAPAGNFPSMAAMLAAQGTETVPAGAPNVGTAPRSIEDQRAFISNDVSRQLIAAGRPPEEAQATGALVAARYEARSARFNGALGTPQDLYEREGAQIRGAKRPPEAPPTEAAPTTPPLVPIDKAEPEPAVTAPSRRKGPSSRDPNTFSLLEAIAANGGIRKDDPLIADLQNSIGANNKFIPGFGQLIRDPRAVSTAAHRGGARAPMWLDQARELAVAHSYIQDAGEITHGVSQSYISDLLNAMDTELRGQKVYRQGYEGPIRKLDPLLEEKYRSDFIAELHDYAKDKLALTPAEETRALQMHDKEGIYDVAEIVDRLALELENGEIEQGFAPPRPEPVAGWDLPHEPAAAPGESRAATENQPAEPGGGAARDRSERDREQAEEIEYFQRGTKAERNLIAEREAEGQQQIPGADRISQAEQAQRLANQPLKPTAEQKPADEGLFDESKKGQGELFQGVTQGKIRMQLPYGREGEKPVITLMRAADASTAIHELGHAWLGELMRDSLHPQAPDELKSDAKTVLDWLGVDSPDAIKPRNHEKFARGFEQYLREGVAPSPGLAQVFAKFRDWMLRIYQSLRGLGPEISPDIRAVFDRMLAAEPQRTVIVPDRMGRPSLADIHEADAAHTEPTESEPVGDRVIAEASRFGQDLPPGVQNAIEAEKSRLTAELAATEAAKPVGEATGGTGEPGPVQSGGELTGPVAAGGAGGAEPGAELPGGGNAVRESDGEREAGERSGAASATDAGLGDKPLAPRPAEQFGARESSFLDKAGNIRLENLTNDADVRHAIHDAAEENNDFIGDRRGVVTDGQVMDLAADLGMVGAEKLVAERVRGQAFNAEQIMALRKLLIQSATEVSEHMKRAAIGTDADLMAYAIAKDRHQMIQATVAQATAEAGRALRAFRNIAGTEGQENINEFLKQATGQTLFQLRREVKLGATLDTPQKVSKFLNDAGKKNFPRMILEYWINGLISGPATHATYMIGNEILALEKAGPETAAAAAIGTLRRAMGREGSTVRLGEVAEQLKAHVTAIPSAVKAALDAFRTGVTTALPGEALTQQNLLPFQPGTELATPAVLDEAAKFSDAMQSGYGILRGIKDGVVSGGEIAKAGGVDPPGIGLRYSPLGAIPDIEIGGINALPLGTIARLPSRFIAAIHSFFRAINYSMEKNALTYRTAANEGLSGTAFDQRVGDLRQSPTQEIMEAAGKVSTSQTLMGKGGEFTQALSRLTNAPIFGFPIFKFIDPFVQISSNIIEKSIVERTPLGILSPEIRADLMGKNGNVAADTAAARMLMGTVYGIALGGLAAEGYVSGSGPSDPRQAAVWRLAGNQAHSVRVGDVWYDVHRLGPLGMLMGVAADMYDVSHAAQSGDLLLAASNLQHAVTQNILDESFMRGPSDLIKAVDDPGRYGESYIRNFLSSFVPYSVGMAQMARASDPYSRQARSVVDALKQKIPGMSETLLPRRDIWGDEMPNRDALLAAGVTAIYESRMSRDPVNLALLQLGIAPAALERKIRNVQLTDDQYDDFQRIGGRMTKMRLDAIVNSPDFRTWPNHIRRDVITEVITQSREAARGVMMMKNPSIARDATQLQLDRKLKD